jgi:hypothetical protein
LAWRSFIPIVFIVALVSACSPVQSAATPSRAPVVAVVTATPTATPTEDPTVAPPTKKPAKTKKPKPTATPVTWSEAYRRIVCSAIARWPTRRRTSTRRPRNSPGRTTRGQGGGVPDRALALQATDQIPTVKAWPQGEVPVGLLTDSANPTAHGASALIDGMASLDVNVMHAAGAEMDTGNGQLDQARAALQDLSLTYGPAGC